jgi:photosystem II stability/assembly factor-like uncharacterized protein
VGGTYDGWWRNIYVTTDAGNTWRNKYGYSEQTGLLSVFMNTNGKGLAVGYSGVIYITEDDGSSWSQILSGKNNLYYTGDWITSVFMVNDTLGWAGGYRKGIWYYPIILQTTNGGKIWKTNSEFEDDFDSTPADIFFLNENIGWVTFYNRSSRKTTDGGDNWFPAGNTGNEKFFISEYTGWAAYEPLGIFKSTDGGINWVQKSSVSSRSLCFPDNNNGFAVGEGGSILKSTDGGDTWFSKASGTTSKLNSVNFYDNTVGICVGNSGTVLLTTDGGEIWTSLNVNTSASLTSVAFPNANSVWIAGSGGIILYSTDSGSSWTTFNGVTENNLISISFPDNNNGWIGGWNGTILKYQSDIIPVELITFTATREGNEVELRWATATETNNSGFAVERMSIPNSKSEFRNPNWTEIGFIQGSGTTTEAKAYSFVDEDVTKGNHKYRLRQIDLDGSYTYSNEIEVEVDFSPEEFVLYQNYPNPFNPNTVISYQLSVTGNVILKVYDILGNEVVTLVNEEKQPGVYEVEFSADVSHPGEVRNLASGIYFYRLHISGFIATRKMVLLR